MLVEGRGTIRLRQLDRHEMIEHEVSGDRFEAVTIPPGVVHSIENTGSGDMVVLFWADEVFDADRPDTMYEPAEGAPAKR
jgi:UDP-2-acetamido-2,6-beta-L-arabino-hexul-4-ose reductase